MVCPSRRVNSSPLLTSQMRMVLLTDAPARRPSGMRRKRSDSTAIHNKPDLFVPPRDGPTAGVPGRPACDAAVRQRHKRGDPAVMPQQLAPADPPVTQVRTAPEAPLARLPSGSTASDLDQAECPSNRSCSVPLLTSQMRMVLSSDPLARRPSCSAASEVIRPSCPSNRVLFSAAANIPDADGPVSRFRWRSGHQEALLAR